MVGFAYITWGAITESSVIHGSGVHSKRPSWSRVVRHQSTLNKHSSKLWHIIFTTQAHCIVKKKIMWRHIKYMYVIKARHMPHITARSKGVLLLAALPNYNPNY